MGFNSGFKGLIWSGGLRNGGGDVLCGGHLSRAEPCISAKRTAAIILVGTATE